MKRFPLSTAKYGGICDSEWQMLLGVPPSALFVQADERQEQPAAGKGPGNGAGESGQYDPAQAQHDAQQHIFCAHMLIGV